MFCSFVSRANAISRKRRRLITLVFFTLAYLFGSNAAQAQRTEDATRATDNPLIVLNVAERAREGRNALSIILSEPVAPGADLDRWIAVHTKNDGKLSDGAWEADANRQQLWFDHVEPETEYLVTVYAGLPAASGSALAEESESLVLTRPLPATVSFDSTGMFLTRDLNPGLPVTSVNVDAVDIDFFKVDAPKLEDLLRNVDGDLRNYWSVDYLTRNGKLVYSGRYALDPVKNKPTTRNISVESQPELGAPGFYIAVMRQPGVYDGKQLAWFAITDIGLHSRRYEQGLNIHVNKLDNGQASIGTRVTLRNSDGIILATARSNKYGIANFKNIPKEARFALAERDTRFVFLQLKQPPLNLGEFDTGKREQLPQELYIYGPRDLYRPGEKVDFSALLRSGDGRRVHTPVLSAEIRGPKGLVLSNFRWRGDETGYYGHQWQIPEGVSTGRWHLEVSGPFQKPAIYSFNIEEFLPERMELSFNNENSTFASKSNIGLPVTGKYLYGAPASGNRLSATVSIVPDQHPVAAFPDYFFAQQSAKDLTRRMQLKDLYLDRDGHSTIEIAADETSAEFPQRIVFSASLFESGGRPVTRRKTVHAWPGESRVGIRPHFSNSGEAPHHTDDNTVVKFDLIKSTLDGKTQAASDVKVSLVREHRSYFWVHDDNRGWHYDWTESEYTLRREMLNLSATEPAQVQFPVEWGYYRLEVRDGSALTSYRFHAGTDWYANWQRAEHNNEGVRPEKITLTLDKKHYQAGDVAKVHIAAAEQGRALVTVEADQLLWTHELEVSKNGTILDIPIDSAWNQHNLYISALMIKPGDRQKSITPKRSFGLIHLPLNRDARVLDVGFDVPKKTLPGEVFNAVVLVSSKHGELPDNVHVTLAAVDVGVLNISGFETPDPAAHFFGQRKYSTELNDIYNDLIEISNADLASLKFGGDMDLAKTGQSPNSDVQIVSLFSGPVRVDSEGHAQIPLELPWFNGRVRLMAVAWSEDSFGSGEQELTVASPVVVQLSIPRFLAKNDRSSLTLDVTNLSDEEKVLNIAVSSDNGLALTAAKDGVHRENTTLKKGDKTTVRLDITATATQGQSTIDVAVSGDGVAQKRQWQLGLRPAWPAQTFEKSAVLNAGDTFTFGPQDLPTLIPGLSQGRVSVSTQPSLDLNSHLRELLSYPYGCLEQTTSRLFPLAVATPAAIKKLGLSSINLAQRDVMLEAGLNRLHQFQLANGGFGFWSNSDPEQYWTTVYVADSLLNAKASGAPVPAGLLASTLKRLEQYVSYSGLVQRGWNPEPKHYQFAYRAYAAFVLARNGEANLGRLRTLYQRHFEDAKTALPKMQLAIALRLAGDLNLSKEALDKAITHYQTTDKSDANAGFRYTTYGGRLRDLALMVHLLNFYREAPDTALEMALDLKKELVGREYLSTQERNALFMAGLSMAGDEQLGWSATINGALVEASGTYVEPLLGRELNQSSASVMATHTAPLFVDALANGFAAAPPKPVSNSFSIERHWYTAEGVPIDHNNGRVFKTGDLVIVRIQVTTEQPAPDALVVDLLPAGFELENQNLQHAVGLSKFKIDGKSLTEIVAQSNIKHSEFRDDRFVAALDARAYKPSQLVYLMRAVTPGTYTVPSVKVEDMYRPDRRAIGALARPVIIQGVVQ